MGANTLFARVIDSQHQVRIAPQVLIIGLGRYGRRLAHGLEEAGLRVLSLDFDRRSFVPHARPGSGCIRGRQRLGPAGGDAAGPCHLGGEHPAGPRFQPGALHALEETNFGGEIVVVARDEVTGATLSTIGAPRLLYPMRNAVDHATGALAELIRNKETST